MEKTELVTRPQTSRGPKSFLSGLRLPGWLQQVLGNRKALMGSLIILFFVFVAVFANQIAPISGPAGANRMVGRPHDPPSSEHIFGTTRQGQDVFTQVVHGTRSSLSVGFLTGTIIIFFCILFGVTAGYVGGLVDEILSLITNVFLIIPGLPLIIVVAGWLERPGAISIVLVLSFTSWSWGARVLRSQTLSLRNREFVAAARVAGEPVWRIVFFEILPNMTSLVVSSWIGAVLYVILAHATLEFVGLGDPNAVSWGTILYWAQNNQALLTRAWWTFIPPGVCIASLGLSLTLINYGIDEITNPRLRVEKGA